MRYAFFYYLLGVTNEDISDKQRAAIFNKVMASDLPRIPFSLFFHTGEPLSKELTEMVINSFGYVSCAPIAEPGLGSLAGCGQDREKMLALAHEHDMTGGELLDHFAGALTPVRRKLQEALLRITAAQLAENPDKNALHFFVGGNTVALSVSVPKPTRFKVPRELDIWQLVVGYKDEKARLITMIHRH